ncbi:MAG: glycosyltransferase family 39 protein [Melioribacteraceae bacterium]|nr:glycosyltransferase family 39 protein [Melioribacteraceae bacterium]
MIDKYLSIKNIIALHLLIGVVLLIIAVPQLEKVGLKSDSPHYLEIAKHLYEDGEFAFDYGPTAYRQPGYPFFIYLVYKTFGTEFYFILFAQSMISCFNLFLFYKIAQIYLDELFSLLAASIYAIMPLVHLYNVMVMSETLFQLILFLTFLTFLKKQKYWEILSGFLIGLLMLIKPYWGIVFIAIAFGLSYSTKTEKIISARRLAVVAVTIIITVSPWLLRNYSQFGIVGLSTNGGVNFWIGNNDEANGGYLFEEKKDNPLILDQNEITRNKAGWKLGIEFAGNNPEKYPKLITRKLKRSLTLPYNEIYYFHFHPKYEFPVQYVSYIPKAEALITFLPYMFFFLLGVFSIFHFKQRYIELLVIYICIIGVQLIFFGAGRFIYPVFPMLIIASLSLFQIRYKFKLDKKNLLPIFAVIIAASVWMHDIIKAIIYY